VAALIKNAPAVLRGIDLWVRRVEAMHVEQYRDLIWETFLRLLNQTPQFSGHAAANWNIGVGAPDNNVYDDALKDEQRAADFQTFLARRRGDRRAIQRAVRRYGGRNGPWSHQVDRRTKVYFTNSVVGNDQTWQNDGFTYYLNELQNPAWHNRLRVVNMPYETAQETIYFVYAKWSRTEGMAGRFGGENLGMDYT
jgi:hypothetical protein